MVTAVPKLPIGTRVRLSPTSTFKGQDRARGESRNSIGTIISYYSMQKFVYFVRWDYGSEFNYNDIDLILLEKNEDYLDELPSIDAYYNMEG
jgi:hypothetical protein